MPTNFNPLGELYPFSDGGPIPPVDPADLRKVWDMQRELRASGGASAGEQIAIDHDFYKRACSPDANVAAVWFRASLLGMLHMFGVLEPWIHEGVVADAVFNVAATFPMNGMAIGVVRQGFPFDVKEFLSQVAAA